MVTSTTTSSLHQPITWLLSSKSYEYLWACVDLAQSEGMFPIEYVLYSNVHNLIDRYNFCHIATFMMQTSHVTQVLSFWPLSLLELNTQYTNLTVLSDSFTIKICWKTEVFWITRVHSSRGNGIPTAQILWLTHCNYIWKFYWFIHSVNEKVIHYS